MARTIQDVNGTTWTVGRRWLPWPPKAVRLARRGELPRPSPFRLLDSLDAVSLFDDGPFAVVIAVGVVLLVIALVVPLVLIFGELLLLALLLPLWVAARVLLRQPWIVVAQTKGPPPQVLARRVVGWNASTDAMNEMAMQLTAGAPPVTSSERRR